MASLDDLLTAMPAEADRREILRIASDLESARGGARDAALDRMLQRISEGLRAARYPLPTRADLERMLGEWHARSPAKR